MWQLLCDLEPEQLVSAIDFRYITDVITKEEALAILKENRPFKDERKSKILSDGYPAYTTQVGKQSNTYIIEIHR